MTSTGDLLRGMGENAYRALEALAGATTPLSGRMVARALDVSPTTAIAALDKLREAGFATASQAGRARQWRLNTDNDTLRTWLEETRASAVDTPAPAGMSPYATGGGGVTFERKVAVHYLTHLLLGDGATELGDSRSIVSVAFQQAPEHSVDDLVIHAARADEPEPSLVLALAVRRAPDLVQSNESSRKLICTFVQEVVSAPTDGPEYRAALVVAGPQEHAEQLAVLADEAATHKDATNFFGLLRTHRKFPEGVRTRLTHIEKLVKLALATLGTADLSAQLVEQRTWELLSRLIVLMPRLETPDELDWARVTNSLIPVARGTDLYGATRLLERLVALADEYPPKAATVDLSLLARDAHQVLDSATRRHRQGWRALGHLHDRALASVRDEIAAEDQRRVHLDRSDTARQLLQLVESPAAAVVAHGDSGVGKSALVVRTLADAAQDPDFVQVVCINLRHLPPTTLILESELGTSLSALLGELSAPQRLLVIDGADALAEGMLDAFLYLIDAAGQADVKVVAVTANDAQQIVRDTINDRCAGEVAGFEVPLLTDAQVSEIAATFDELSALAADSRSRELLRRPVVVDLLVRGGVKTTPLSDADAMQQVWSGLVLRQRPGRGTPDARNIALLRLAALELGQGDALEVVGAIDPTALAGLRQDGVLRTETDDPFAIGPQFAHDEVRRYAIARLLLSAGHPTAKLVEVGVPRWALGAARLACQALLAAPDTPKVPLRGRFARLQKAFDGLVEAGHGDRWGDVPGEALLTLGAPDPVLREVWPMLRAEPGTGLQRLIRLVDQRLHDEAGLVRIAAAEPLIALLLEEDEPWRQGKHVQGILRDWLHAVIIADAPAGYPLRVRLHDRLVEACAAADRRLSEEKAAASAAQAALSAEEAEAERRFLERQRLLFMGDSRRRVRRRRRLELPREITDELMIELLALLGPDLGEDGEAVLRRVARDAPAWARPAVEELLTGRALAMYRRGFLAELTEAYYLNEDEDGTAFHEDGIRRHLARGLGTGPLSAWYRGPFMPLFQSDFRNGVSVLNRMLNHAALARARTLVGNHRLYGAQIEDHDLDAFRTELDVAGARRTYVGDSHVWFWYRGTGVGPYPCMSALQALERVCDQLVGADIPLTTLVAILLEDCENLAMVGLVVGLIVRHLEHADRLLDRYLTEPVIWRLEFTRVVQEASGLRAATDQLAAPERRRWSLREAAMMMVLSADDQRTDELRLIGQQLVATARRLAEGEPGELDELAVQEQLVRVRAWASSLDRGTYQAQRVEGGLQIQSTPPADVVEALQTKNIETARAQEAIRLSVRYYINPRNGKDESIDADELVSDLASAQELLVNPPDLDPSSQWDEPAAVAATALTANIVDGVDLPVDALRFAVDTLLRIGEGAASPRRFESEDSYFEQGADRIAAQALPLLLLPAAAELRAQIDGKDGSTTYRRAAAAAGKLARSLVNEVRVHLARGLDHVWQAACTAGDSTCHHETAFQLAVETMRDCILGDWDPEISRRKVAVLGDPVAHSLAEAAADSLYVDRLDGAIRALGPAAAAPICVSTSARGLLDVLLTAHRRSLLAAEEDIDSRGTHALIAARALLVVASAGEDAPVFQYIDAYADDATLLESFLCALSSAAEESADRADTARRMWPAVVARVIALQDSGHTPFAGRSEYRSALASLLPNPAPETAYLYREVQGEPIVWWDPLAWQDTVAHWLPIAQGRSACVDQLIAFIKPLPAQDQVRVGLPWVANLVLADPSRIANRTYLLTSWLIELRQAVADAGVTADWQRVVDALVVAGASRLAPYSE